MIEVHVFIYFCFFYSEIMIKEKKMQVGVKKE